MAKIRLVFMLSLVLIAATAPFGFVSAQTPQAGHTTKINKQLDQLQIRIYRATTFDELAILQGDLEKVKERIDSLPDSKETEEVKEKFSYTSASLKEERMELKARFIKPDIWPGRPWLLLVITDEKDLDALLEEVQKIRELYSGYMEKAENTEYYHDFRYAYEEFENNVREEFIERIVLRKLQADLQSKSEMSERFRKQLEKDIEETKEELKEIQEELKKSETELKEICSKIDKLGFRGGGQQLTTKINKQLDQLQIRIYRATTFDELAILKEDLAEVKERIDLLPVSKETEQLKKKFSLISASLKEERMELKAEALGYGGRGGLGKLARDFLLLAITEKDLDALLEEIQKVRELYRGYMEKAEGTEYYYDFENAYEEFENNIRDELIMKVILRKLQAELKTSKQDRKEIEEDIKFRNDELSEIQKELKKSEIELKEICSKIDKLS